MAVTVYKNAILFIVIFGFSGSLLLCRLSPVAASGGCSLAVVPRLLTAVAFLVVGHGL